MVSNLPKDLVEEMLCRIPLTSLRTVRSTCKKWNSLSKCQSFAKKHLSRAKVVAAKEREFMVVMMIDYRVNLMSVNLDKDVESCIKPQGKLISLDHEVDANVTQVFHCDGLLLCITKDYTRLMVWNPYWGQLLRIEPTHNFHILDKYSYALGYGRDKNSKSYKILRFIDYDDSVDNFVEFNIYDFNSGSWRVLDVSPRGWEIFYAHYGVSLKGNTYFFATEKYLETRETEDSFLVCFDFTSETFGPPLPLPFEFYVSEDTVSLSIVRGEQLVHLYQPWDTLIMNFWVTTKIEPNIVSWKTKVFLNVNIQQLIQPQFQFTDASFFIDEEKGVAAVFHKDKDIDCLTSNNTAYIFGVDGSVKEVDLGECANKSCFPIIGKLGFTCPNINKYVKFIPIL